MLTKAKAEAILNQNKCTITEAVLSIKGKKDRWFKFNQMLRKYLKQKFPATKNKTKKIIGNLWG